MRALASRTLESLRPNTSARWSPAYSSHDSTLRPTRVSTGVASPSACGCSAAPPPPAAAPSVASALAAVALALAASPSPSPPATRSVSSTCSTSPPIIAAPPVCAPSRPPSTPGAPLRAAPRSVRVASPAPARRGADVWRTARNTLTLVRSPLPRARGPARPSHRSIPPPPTHTAPTPALPLPAPSRARARQRRGGVRLPTSSALPLSLSLSLCVFARVLHSAAVLRATPFGEREQTRPPSQSERRDIRPRARMRMRIQCGRTCGRKPEGSSLSTLPTIITHAPHTRNQPQRGPTHTHGVTHIKTHALLGFSLPWVRMISR